MSTLVNVAVSAVISALQSGTPVASQIARVRLRTLSQGTAQAVIVRPVGTQVTEAALAPGYPVSWNTSIAVECYARSLASAAPDVAVDSLVEAVYARLMADPTLGGSVLALQPQELSYDFDADAENTVCATFVFHARQRAVGATFN